MMPACLRTPEIHRFCQDGQRLVVDVRDVRVYAISRLEDEILAAPEGTSLETLRLLLDHQYSDVEISRALERLSKRNLLLPDSVPPKKASEMAFPGVTRLQLSVAQDCNLRCRYCIVEQGSFGVPRHHMSRQMARHAVDFLMRESGAAANCTLGFSGGEPMLNWHVVRDAITYCGEQAAGHSKQTEYFVKTNGTLLDNENIAFIKEQRINVYVSLDGPPAVHDRMRSTLSGRGSHEVVTANLSRLLAACPEQVFLRATLTRYSPLLPELLDYLKSFGAHNVGLIRVIAKNEDYALDQEARERLKDGCTQLARRFVSGEPVDYAAPLISGFLRRFSLGPRACPIVRPGGEYMIVSGSGCLYPHPALAEQEKYCLGHVSTGFDREKLGWWRSYLDVDKRAGCRDCWARYTCDGGCFPAAAKFQGTPDKPNEADCRVIRHLIELAAWVHMAAREKRAREAQNATRGFFEVF